MENDYLAVRYRGRRKQMTRHLEHLSINAFIDVEIESTFCPESHMIWTCKLHSSGTALLWKQKQILFYFQLA